MDTVKPKRFSFSGFGTSLSRSLSFNKTKDTSLPTPPSEEQQEAAAEEQRRNRRAQKSKSLYVKSFRKSVESDSSAKKSFDASEATQTNSKEVRSAIRRSLSAVLYASPHSSSSSPSETTNKLVPILVTPGLSDSVGGILIDDGSTPLAKTTEAAGATATATAETKKKKPVEYDNRLEVFCNKNNDAVTILWQGYGYTIEEDDNKEVASEMLVEKIEETPQDLEARFEKDVWESYRGLVHPLHLFLEKTEDTVMNRGRWAGLSVTELRRYYDNYGSMMLKIRQNRMIKQQEQYHCSSGVKKEWIITIPEGETNKDKLEQQEELSDI
jgi:hypothetical protein